LGKQATTLLEFFRPGEKVKTETFAAPTSAFDK
jgi:hypothetical protein